MKIPGKKDPLIDFMLAILGAVAEFERNHIVEMIRGGKMRAILYGTKSDKPMHGSLKEIPEKAIIR